MSDDGSNTMHEEIDLSESAKAHIAGLVSAGNCTSASEYIESLIQEDRQTRTQLAKHINENPGVLEPLAVEGLDSGQPVNIDGSYWKNKREQIRNGRNRS